MWLAETSDTCTQCTPIENAFLKDIYSVPAGCPGCVYDVTCDGPDVTNLGRCQDGYFKIEAASDAASDSCGACSPVEGAASFTCTEVGNSRASCGEGFFKTDNSATTPSQSDTCTACTPVPGATSIVCDATGNSRASCEDDLVHVDNNDAGSSDMCCTAVDGAASITCTEVGNSRAICEQGFYLTDNAFDATSDACTACAWVEGACSTTCTGPDNSRALCCDGFGRTDNSDHDTSDVCQECGGELGLPGTYLTSEQGGICEPCSAVENAVRVTCTERGQSSAVECSPGYFLDHTQDGDCVACQPVENALTIECENRFESNALTCEEGFSLESGRCEPDGPPPSPPAPPAPPPPATKVIATLTLDGDLETVAGAEGSAEREIFETAFKDDVAASIGVPTDRIAIVSITAASIEVVFEVLPTSSGESVEASVVRDAFSDVVALPTVGVSTTGPVDYRVETVHDDDDIDLSNKSSIATSPAPLVGWIVLAAMATAASLSPH